MDVPQELCMQRMEDSRTLKELLYKKADVRKVASQEEQDKCYKNISKHSIKQCHRALDCWEIAAVHKLALTATVKESEDNHQGNR